MDSKIIIVPAEKFLILLSEFLFAVSTNMVFSAMADIRDLEKLQIIGQTKRGEVN